MRGGKFIVFYGANNVGKSTQVKLLAKRLEEQGQKVKTVKYPVYDLEPTGPQINAILRGGEVIPPADVLQELYAQNRRDFEPTLDAWLEQGYTVVAEDYEGTGIARGLVEGLADANLENINFGLRKPDVSILIDGPRRTESIEAQHVYEHDGKWEMLRITFLDLAGKFGWKIVDGSKSVDEVADTIGKLV